MRSSALLLAIVVALAGCSDGGNAPTLPVTEAEELPALHGWVFDPALRPVPGVRLSMIETNQTVVTTTEGYYEFPDAPRGELLVLVATVEGFTSSSRQVNVPMESYVRLNFTLTPVPIKVPSKQVLEHALRIVCEGTVVANEEATPTDCSGGTGQDNVWEFSVAPELAGAVIEVFWTAGTPAAEDLLATLETLGLGDYNFVVGQAVGASPLRIAVPQDVAEKYFPAGGRMRLSIHSEPAVDEEEAGTGASFAVNQDYEAFASLFYVEPPNPTYTVAQAD